MKKTYEELLEDLKKAVKDGNTEVRAEIKTEIEALTKANPKDRPDDNIDDGNNEEKIFPAFGDFIKSVVNRDAKLIEYREKVLSMGSDPDGGYLVPEDFKADLLKVASEDGIIRPFATVLPAGSSPDTAVNIPVLNQAGAAEKDFFSGVWFTWCEEGADKTNKEISIDSVKLEPHEYNAYAVLTDKLIRNAPVMETYVRQVYSRAQIAFEDYYFLRGTGVNQPLGIIPSPAYIQTNRAVAGAIAYADILQIMGQILPGCSPMWVISRSAFASVVGLADGAGNSIFIQGDATKGTSDRLFGYPIKWTFRAPALGAVGDISLVDASYYLIKDGFGPAFDFSKHVYFLKNQSVLKMFGNVDGQPWLNGTITAEDAATEVSPFVGLRAAGA